MSMNIFEHLAEKSRGCMSAPVLVNTLLIKGEVAHCSVPVPDWKTYSSSRARIQRLRSPRQILGSPIGGLQPGMAQCHGLASERRKRFKKVNFLKIKIKTLRSARFDPAP
jgi:hypothetical protein